VNSDDGIIAALVLPALRGVWQLGKDAQQMLGLHRQHSTEALNRLVDQLQEESVRVHQLRVSYLSELERLQQLRWQTQDQMAQVRDAAIAARLMVRELERKLGLPESRFDPLPPFPPVPAGGDTSPKAGP
jgi:cell division septum initiation protein DivIVA